MARPVLVERRLSLGAKLLYCLGASGTSMKLAAISTFLVIYYNQVLKVDPAVVGMVLMVTVFADAIFDPIIGQISDNFRSRLGRRHPFMLASALPYAVSFFLLWNPPAGLSDGAMGWYLLACLLSVRFFDTFFELPHQALAPEMAKDYDERTKLLAWRQCFTVAGGLSLALMAYLVFLKEEPDGSGGVLARDGYFALSVTVSIVVFLGVLVSTLGTLRQVPFLAPAPTRKITVKGMAGEVVDTLRNRAFIVTTIVGMLWAVASGARGGFDIYFGLYFWEMKQSQLAVLATITATGGVLGVTLAPILGRRFGKKYGLIAASGLAAMIHMTPVTLRLLGLAPPNGTPELLVLLYSEEVLNATFSIAAGVLMASILADVVEDAEVKTGRRSEGLLLSAGNLFRKSVSGIGIFTATTVLTVIHFPIDAERGEVSEAVLRDLGLAYIPLVAGLWSVALICLFALKVSRKQHDDNLRTLAERATRIEAH